MPVADSSLRGLAEDHDPPGGSASGLKRLRTGHRVERPAPEVGLGRISLQHGPEEPQPRLAASFEKRFELKRIDLAHSRQSTGL
jgi:hypothetical protein